MTRTTSLCFAAAVGAMPALAAAALAVALLEGCSGSAAVPKGPAPEYEDPPRPSWLDAGAPPPAPPAPAPTLAPAIVPGAVPLPLPVPVPDAG